MHTFTTSRAAMHALVPPRYPTPASKPPRVPPLNKALLSATPDTPSASPATSGDSLESPASACHAAAALDASIPSVDLSDPTPGKDALEAALDALENNVADRTSTGDKLSTSDSSCALLRSSSTCDSLSSVGSAPSLEWPRRTTRSPANRLDGKMRAAYVPRHGPPAVFRLGWVDRPTRQILKPGQALVRIAAAGVNSADCKLRSGALRRLLPIPFPAVLGTDLAGTIVHAVPGRGGECVLSPGDRVYGQAELGAGFGAYAEWAVVSLRRVARMPRNLSFAQAAALPTVSLAAHAALVSYARLKPGERVLVFGGTSGIGHAALQLAVALGAVDVSTTCSARNAAFCERLGASRSFDYHGMSAEEIVKAAKPDVVLDTAGTPVHWAAVQAQAPGARFVVASGSECLGALAFAAGVGYLDVLDGLARAAGRKAISRIRKGGYDLVMPSALDVPLETITPFVERGQLVPSIFKEFSLCDVAKAHALRENKRPRGKVIINVAEGSAF